MIDWKSVNIPNILFREKPWTIPTKLLNLDRNIYTFIKRKAYKNSIRKNADL